MKPRLLLVEDQGEYAFMLHRHFEHYMPGYEIVIASTLHEALAICARCELALIVLDLTLLDSEPANTVDAITVLSINAPVVVLTGAQVRDTPTFTDCFAHGAADVWEKSALHGLGLNFFIYACNSAIARNESRKKDAARP